MKSPQSRKLIDNDLLVLETVIYVSTIEANHFLVWTDTTKLEYSGILQIKIRY